MLTAPTLRVNTHRVKRPEVVLAITRSPARGREVRHELGKDDAMGTTTNIERERALAWIARQLRWERTLTDLRQGEVVVARQAA
jgi:hypothetical protein